MYCPCHANPSKQADANTSTDSSLKSILSKRFIRPEMLVGTLTAAAGVYIGTQMEDDSHSEDLLDIVGDKLLDNEKDRRRDSS